MYNLPNKCQVRKGVGIGWPEDVCRRGYDAFPWAPGIFRIEVIDDMELPFDDEDAAKNAEEIGFCEIIQPDELPVGFPGGYCWVDTPATRRAIAEYCARHNTQAPNKC